MNIHEYQAKEILKRHGVGVLNGFVVRSAEEAKEAALKLQGNTWTLKAQIHSGGRGKAGGIKFAKSVDEIPKLSNSILGHTLITHQTGEEGKKVRALLIEECCDIEHEYYVGLMLDRKSSKIAFIVSTEGGIDIEKTALEHPEKIIKVLINPSVGFSTYVARKLAYQLGLSGEYFSKAEGLFSSLYQIYTKYDCRLLEINPLVTTKNGEFAALDAKINFDDTALVRHPEILSLRDVEEESNEDRESFDNGFYYIALNGDIGCLTNGAGLAMATMDVIRQMKGEPANFLDIGGAASKEKVAKAFSLILKDKRVKTVLVNIFGGSSKCDVIAEGIAAVKTDIPIVLRMEGTNVAIGKKKLLESGLKVVPASSIDDAVTKAVNIVKGKES